MGKPLLYAGPASDRITDDDVRAALDFIVAVEPDPEPETRQEYEAQTRAFTLDVARAEATLTKYAQQIEPFTLDQMQQAYYSFANDTRYLVSVRASAIVTSALNAAWKSVGPWRR